MADSPPIASRSACIVGRTTGVGLDRDAALVRELLDRDGWTAEWRLPRSLPLLQRLPYPRRPERALVVFLERAFPAWRRTATHSVLIPNQERFPLRHLGRLRALDAIFCKTRHATELFAQHHPNVQHLGFTSPDCREVGVAPDYRRFLHLAGRSTLKGTSEVLEAWARHPEWPTLTLVMHRDNAPPRVPANVELIARLLGDSELRQIQNRCGIHLCPSRSEGWGHYIVEAMSCQAVTVTTDAPPMNELITAQRGILVPSCRDEPRHLGTNYFVDTAQLEAYIDRLLETPVEDLARIGQAARQWFEQNDTRFRQRFQELFAALRGS